MIYLSGSVKTFINEMKIAYSEFSRGIFSET